jgi:hypothetical protein
MAWGDKHDRLVAENGAMKREIELLEERIADLKDERVELKAQLKHTQEALIAKESPEAYRDQKYAEDQASREAPSEGELAQKRKHEQQSGIRSQWLSEMEKPLFEDADDMIQLLTRAVGTPLGETQSLHGNDES